MPTCQKKDQLCRCIDWPDEDFDVEIDHFIRNFEFLHVELEYASLDAREPVRVCRIGRCRVCGGRMCDGTTLPPEKTVNGSRSQKAGILWSCAAATEAGVRRDEEKEDHLF